jgi:lipopolysaccharide export system permease protein
MRLLQRHFLKEFIKLFFVTGVGLSLIMTLLDLIRRTDVLLPHDPSAVTLAHYASLNLPRYFLSLMPFAALLCSLYTVGFASRTREIVAVMAAGGRVRRLLMPIVLAGALMSLMGFAVGEFLVPACSMKAKEIRNSILKVNHLPSAFHDGNVWLRAEDGSIVKMELYIEETDSFRGVSVFRLGEKRIEEILSAAEAKHSVERGTWVLKDVRKYHTETGDVSVFGELDYPHLGSPELFREKVKKTYEMGLVDLNRYLRRLREAGFKNLRLTVEMHSKISYPLITFFMVILGVSFPARRDMGGLVATAVGLLVSLLYWFGYTMMLSFGYAGILPPIVSAWIMPLIFGSLSVYLFIRIAE